jgi:hypothetical protein
VPVPDIRHQLQIAARPEALFPLVTSAAGFAEWWAEAVRELADPLSGVELRFFGGRTVYRLRPQTFVAPTQAAWLCESGEEWAGTQVTFILARREAGTLLHFVHAGWRQETDYFVSCNTTWGALMFRLRAVAEGHPQGPLFTSQGIGY